MYHAQIRYYKRMDPLHTILVVVFLATQVEALLVMASGIGGSPGNGGLPGDGGPPRDVILGDGNGSGDYQGSLS